MSQKDQLHAAVEAMRQAAVKATENWPLSPQNMEVAERYAKHGWGNAVAGVCQVDIIRDIRAIDIDAIIASVKK